MLLDRIEEKDKEFYDKIFNEYKTAYCKAYGKNRTFTDEEVRHSLEYRLEDYEFKAEFVNELCKDDLILNNLHEFAEFCSKNIHMLL